MKAITHKTFTPLEKKHAKANGSLTGFTLIELILVVAIVAVLAGVMIPVITSARQKARAAKFLQLVDTLKTACIMYHSDVGGGWQGYITENQSYPQPFYHPLTVDNGKPGWDGPYIERPLTPEDIYVTTRLIIRPWMADDFDLDGDGTLDKNWATAGNSILLFPIPESAARILNDQADNNVPGNWMSTGRVNYVPAGGVGWVIIYLIGGS